MILRKLIASITIFLIPILIFLNQYFLLSLLIRLNIFKKGTKNNTKTYKNILVFTKAAGLNDLVYALNSQKTILLYMNYQDQLLSLYLTIISKQVSRLQLPFK